MRIVFATIGTYLATRTTTKGVEVAEEMDGYAPVNFKTIMDEN